MIAALKEYKETMKKETGVDYSNVNITLEKKEFLNENSMGGVLLKARKGKIILDNTLASRLKVCQQSLAPIIRFYIPSLLFFFYVFFAFFLCFVFWFLFAIFRKFFRTKKRKNTENAHTQKKN